MMLGYFAQFWPVGYWSQWWPVYGLVITPACRVYTMPVEDRVYTMPVADRVYEVQCG